MGGRPRRDEGRTDGRGRLTTLLLDTSAWVEFLRDTGSSASAEVGRLLQDPAHEVATCDPVVMELLAGASTPQALRTLETLTDGLRLLPLDNRLDVHAAAAAYRAARLQGRTVRKLVDCLIAVVAERHGAALVHRDADFDVLAGCLSRLQVRSLL